MARDPPRDGGATSRAAAATSAINRKKEHARIEAENAVLMRKLAAVRREPPGSFHAPDGKLTLRAPRLTREERDKGAKRQWPIRLESKMAIRERQARLDKALEDRSHNRHLAKIEGEARRGGGMLLLAKVGVCG